MKDVGDEPYRLVVRARRVPWGRDTTAMAAEIFICYRRLDQDKARLLHALLKQRSAGGYDPIAPSLHAAFMKAWDETPLGSAR